MDERRPGDPLDMRALINQAGRDFAQPPPKRVRGPSIITTHIPMWLRVSLPAILIFILIAVYVAPQGLYSAKYLKQGRALISEGRLTEALDVFAQAHELSPESAGPSAEMTKIYLQMGDQRKADQVYNSISPKKLVPADVEEISKLRKSLAAAQDMLGQASQLVQQRKYQDAIGVCEAAVRVQPYNYSANLMLAGLYYQWYQFFGQDEFMVLTKKVLNKLELIDPYSPQLRQLKRSMRLK